MTNLSSLVKIRKTSAKRLGRGQGSGKAKTTGRGTKGQNARHKLSITHSHFEGGQRPLSKRLPFRRGQGNSKMSVKPIILTIDKLNLAGIKGGISINTLIEKGLITEAEARRRGIKILGSSKNQSLDIKINFEKVGNKRDKQLSISKSLQSQLG